MALTHSQTYRRGHIDDIEAVFCLNWDIFDESWSKSVMLQSLQVGYNLFVCHQGETLVGYVLSQDILFETQVMQLAVAADYRRMSIAKQLMVMLIQEKQGYDAILLEVRASNAAAQAFYKALNFEMVGKRPNYYAKTKNKPREDALLFSLLKP